MDKTTKGKTTIYKTLLASCALNLISTFLFFTQNTKDRAPRTPLKTAVNSRMVNISCSICGTCHVTLVANPV